MVKVLLHGCCGRMGHRIAEMAAQDPDVVIAAGVDAGGEKYANFPVYHSLEEAREDVDVVIDFSTAAAVPGLLDWCKETKTPVIVCTTGLSEEVMEHLHAVSDQVAVLKSANMSVGINLIEQILREAAPKLLAAGFDCEIVEKHHNQKVDAPSGTALALADAVNESAGGDLEYVFDRSQRREKRPKKEIGISSVRAGTIVGDHDVIFAGEDEVITFSHTAYSRAIFAKGALTAAKFLAGKPAGFYDMQDVLA
ncbi:MAG: 4-hydroxy-tetrahydrodipicolinate reductase [Lachnospiraceae bacterium]